MPAPPAAVSALLAIRPECRCTTRSQRAASAVSWVTSTSVVPCSRWPRNSSSMISPPVASSRLPVGSSATRIAGSGASARASATRCCSPPESCGRIMRQAAAEPDRVELALGAGERVARAGKLERHGDVLQRRHGRDQVEGLKDDADILAAEARQRVFVELAAGLRRRRRRRRCRAAPARSSP